MNSTTNYELDKMLVQEHQVALIRSARQGAGPVRRTAGTVLIRLGEWMRGKAEAAADGRAESTPTTLKAA